METSLFKHIHKGMYYILSTGCDFCGIKKKGGGQNRLHKKTTLKCHIGLWLPTYCLLRWLMKMKKTKTADYTC